MGWQAIARKDIRDSIRSRGLWILLGFFAFLVLLFAYIGWIDDSADVDGFIRLTMEGFALIVPLVAIVLGYKSVVFERQSGTIALTLSLPHTRGDTVIGKFVGRALVFSAAVVVAMGGVLAIILSLYDNVPLIEYLLFIGLNLLYGLAFLGLAMALSMSTTSGRRATAGAFGAYVLLVMLWSEIVNVLLLILWRFEGSVVVSPPDWSLLLQLMSPQEAYLRVGASLFDMPTVASVNLVDGAPWFVGSWSATLILLAWVGVTLGLGYLAFRRSDL